MGSTFDQTDFINLLSEPKCDTFAYLKDVVKAVNVTPIAALYSLWSFVTKTQEAVGDFINFGGIRVLEILIEVSLAPHLGKEFYFFILFYFIFFTVYIKSIGDIEICINFCELQ